MSSISKLAILALLVPVAACASASQPEASADPAEGPTAHDTANLAICGADTAASVLDADGRRLTFCVADGGREIIAEESADGMISVLPRRHPDSTTSVAQRREACALDVFLAHSPADTPVPVALKASCESRRGHVVDVGARKLSAAAVLQPARNVAGLKPMTDMVSVDVNSNGTKYCNTVTGPSAFVLDFCMPLCTTFGLPCVQACTPRFWSSSLRQCAETNIVLEHIVSCTGWTRVLVDARDGSGDPWSNKLDTWVGPNRHVEIFALEHGDFGQDSDIRVRGSSEAGATHMHAFECDDM